MSKEVLSDDDIEIFLILPSEREDSQGSSETKINDDIEKYRRPSTKYVKLLEIRKIVRHFSGMNL